MKTLHFKFRNDYFMVNEKGEIKTDNMTEYIKEWRFLGGSKHHWKIGLDVNLIQAFRNPELLNGCLGWDVDHGTIRQWGGCYNGKLPRITDAYITEG